MELQNLPKPANEHTRDDTDFMKPVIAALHRKPLQAAKTMVWAIAALLVVAIIWANVAEIDEISMGEGKVVPSGQVKKIAHLEGGIVKKIYVDEGTIVKPGQLLLTIDSTVAKSRYDEGIALYYGAKAAIERLNAQINGQTFVPSPELQSKAPTIAQREVSRYKAAIDKVNNDKELAVRDVEQRRQELAELEGKATSLAEKLKLNEEELSMMEPLVISGAVSKVELLRSKKQVIDNKSELSSTMDFINKAKAALAQAEGKVENIIITARNYDSQELKEHIKMLENTQQAIVSGKDSVSRSDIRSPVSGIVKLINTGTIGGVVQAGQVILEVVPVEESLIIEAKILPKDIAFIKPGLPATVRMNEFDSSIYGSMEATVIEISADALVDEREMQYFRVSVKTKKNYVLGKGKEKLYITPGMTSTVDVITGKRTIWEYLMMPISRGSDIALTER